MKQVVLNIPDGEFEFFMQLIHKFNYKPSDKIDLNISEKDKALVIKRRKTAKKNDYITVSQSNEKLKKKYGF